MTGLMRRIGTWWRGDEGTASIEFVLIVPMFLMLFAASFESGLFMVRQMMLERALDMTMRELRLGHYVNPTHALLKTEICSRLVVISDCENKLRMDLRRVNMTTWNMPSAQPVCRDRVTSIDPVVDFDPGQRQDVILVRLCAIADGLFPTSAFSLGLPVDSNGRYRMMAISAFVNET